MRCRVFCKAIIVPYLPMVKLDQVVILLQITKHIGKTYTMFGPTWDTIDHNLADNAMLVDQYVNNSNVIVNKLDKIMGHLLAFGILSKNHKASYQEQYNRYSKKVAGHKS